MADPDWRGGRYFAEGTNPRRGLAVARMGAHITYLSDAALHRKFGRRFQNRDNPTFSFDADFQVESYLRHQGITFVERFDANSYLYLTRAMDYFDLAADYDGVLANAFKGTNTRFCVVSFTSDWLFPTAESRATVHALNASGGRVWFAEIVTDKGHDAFDYVVLSQTLQATRHPRIVLEHMLRIGRRAVVSFPNFGHWKIRLKILVGGRMPVTDNLPDAWYETSNIHFCTIKDFRDLC